MLDHYTRAVLRVLDPQGKTTGAAFLVAPDLAVTCAHVVDLAGGAPGQTLRLAPAQEDAPFSAVVLVEGWSPADRDDLAFLRIESAPPGLETVLLASSSGTNGHHYLLMGFPDGAYTQTWADGVIRDDTVNDSRHPDRRPLIELGAQDALLGMSGAPVFDERGQRVIGMFCEIDDRGDRRRGYAVSSTVIQELSPAELTFHVPLELDAVLRLILAALDRVGKQPSNSITITGDARNSVVIQGEGNSVAINLNDAELAPRLARDLIPRRDLNSYLLWLTVRDDLQRWSNAKFIPLLGKYDLPRTYHRQVRSDNAPAQNEKIDILAAVEKYKKFILLGAPGAGKSTSLEKIAFEQAAAIFRTKSKRFPLLIRLAAQQGRACKEFLAQEWNALTGESFHDYLAAGKLQILLDGVNELPRESLGELLNAWRIFAAEAVARGNQVIFTGRLLDYQDTLDLELITIQPLDPALIEKFLRDKALDELWLQVREPQNSLWMLAANPFWLNLLVESYRPGEKVTNNRGRLFADFIARCCGRERMLHPAAVPPDSIRLRALEAMAFNWQEKGLETEIEPSTAQVLLPQSLVDEWGELHAIRGPELFRFARDATFFETKLKDDRTLEGKIRFFHHLLREYFAALELNRRFAAGEDLSRLWRAPRLISEIPPGKKTWEPLAEPEMTGWEETTLLAAGVLDDPTALIAAVRAVNPGLAGLCLDEAGLAGVEPLILGGLKIGLQTERPGLAAVLDACRETLLGEMRSPPVHLRARLRAGRVLGRIGDPRLVLREKDGLRYILPEDWVPVPAGRYPIGSRAGDPQAYPDEQPPFEIDLDAFSIARRPVTNAEFACFVAAGGYEREELWEGERACAWLDGRSDLGEADFPDAMWMWQFVQTAEGKNQLAQSGWSPERVKYYTETVAIMSKEDYLATLTRRLDAKSRRRPQYWDDSDWNGANLPVTGVTWFEARAYCAWLAEISGVTLRLPDEFEWEAAARGKEGRIYPWGPEEDENRANTLEGRVQRPTPVGLYAAADGIGPGGAEDQAGNVWEWTLSPYTQDYHQAPQTDRSNEESRFRVARGGSWYYDGWFARCACRGGNVPDGFFIDIGFRLLSPGPSVPAA